MFRIKVENNMGDLNGQCKIRPKYVCARVVFCFSLVVLFSGCDTDQPAPLGRIEEPVAYVGRPDADPDELSSASDQELMLLDAASGKTWQLTDDWAYDQHPVWSPSGTHLMFISGREVGIHWPVPPWPTSTGIEKLFVYSLKNGEIRHVDLSWAKRSGPAAPKGSELTTKMTGWLECATWVPMDTTQIVIAAEVGLQGRILLLNTEEQEARLLASYGGDICYRLMRSPDGKHVAFRGENKQFYLNLESGKRFSFQGGHTLGGDSLYYRPLDWGAEGHSLFVTGERHDPDSTAVYEYDIREKSWSPALGTFGPRNEVVQVIPQGQSGRVGSPDLLIRRDSSNTRGMDFWRYKLPEKTFKRLTYDRTFKIYEASYHGHSGDVKE